jgi:aryl-alcohol dehydrogenase-like predicted oxidoreductase
MSDATAAGPEGCANSSRGPCAATRLPPAQAHRDQEFPENDHRNYNREGEAFDVGETFAGVPFEAGLDAVDALDERLPDDRPLPEFALRWILDHDAVSTVIPGSTSPEHVRENAAAADLEPLSHETHGAVQDVYEEHVKDYVHHRW